MKNKTTLERIREKLQTLTLDELRLVHAFILGMEAGKRAAGAGRDRSVTTETAGKVRKVTRKKGGAK